MAYKTLLFEKKDGICTITLNRPQRLNALSKELLDELDDATEEIIRDNEIKAIIITGGPRADGRPCFSAGADLKDLATGIEAVMAERKSVVDTIEDLLKADDRTGFPSQRTFEKIENLSKPTIAAIDGVCAAGGLELALCCDIIYVSETAQICDPHLKHLGVVGGIGGPTRLARRIGAARAKEMIFTGDMIDGQEAFSIGLANRVFTPDELMSATTELASKIAQMRPYGLRMNKFAVNAATEMDLVRALRYGYICAVASQDTAVKAAASFVNKEKPEFED